MAREDEDDGSRSVAPKAPGRIAGRPEAELKEKISPAELSSIKSRVVSAVNKLISSQEQAIAAFEGSREKPQGMEGRIAAMRRYNDELSAWLREFLVVDEQERVFPMLRRLRALSKAYGGI